MDSHTGEDVKGRVKEAAGDITGDADLKREGQIDQASAATKKAIDDVADTIKDAVSPKK
ncbi:MAG: CsbD family protein [Coriobacteriia bacterium]|nr:CsbD family protein [Coriobacteriia bacterium]